MEVMKTIVDVAQAAAALAGGASAVFAGLTIKKASKDKENSQLLGHAKISIERAFQALCRDTAPDCPPPSDRLAWLTSARLIEEYKSAKSRINDDLTLQECESYEEHWRQQFNLRLELIENGTADYFGPRRTGEGIQRVSAIIVYSFATWPEHKTDPIDKYPTTDAAYKKLGIHKRWFKLRQYYKQT